MSEHGILESVGLARDQLTALRASLEKAGGGPGLLPISNALRELQELLDVLQARYGLLRDILDRTSDIVFAKDRDGRYTMINPRGAEVLGRTMAEVLGADDRDLYAPADAERLMAIDREVMGNGAARTHEVSFDFRGEARTLLTTTTAWHDKERNVRGVIGIARDVTELRRSERTVTTTHDRMRTMAVEIVIGEERLRRALAAELHDGLGQDVALAKLKLAMLRSSASEELHDPLSGLEQLVDRAERSLRSITFQISPPSLHDLGLVAALQWLGEDIASKHGIAVHVEDHASPAVTDERVRVILFRAVRELLINAAAHAHVREATVRLDHQDGMVRITVEDAGAGFDPNDFDRQGFGLFGIREQLKYVDGTVEITSAPGRGTKVTLTAPAWSAASTPLS